MLLAAATVATGSLAADSISQNTDTTTTSPSLKLDAEALGAKPTPSPLGLKPQSAPVNKESILLPFGLNYNRDARSLLVPIDQKNEWGVGLNLDVNSSRAVELAPPSSPLGLQPKRTPGLMLQKKF